MASVPFEFECDKAAGFVMDSNTHPRVGYVTALDGFGLSQTLSRDLQVQVTNITGAKPSVPSLEYTAGSGADTPAGAKFVGVIEKFSWNGGAGNPIKLDFYVSLRNAMVIKALQPFPLQPFPLQATAIASLAWWIVDYEQETKKWFEQSYPLGPSHAIAGIIGGTGNTALNVDLTPVPVKDGIGVNVYKVSIAVAPAPNKQYTLYFADSSQKNVVKSWGLLAGTPASGADKS
jgi:hypothetical protein